MGQQGTEHVHTGLAEVQRERTDIGVLIRLLGIGRLKKSEDVTMIPVRL